MKKLIITAALILLAATAQAQSVRFVNGDESELTALCIAAAQGESNVNELATKLGIRSFVDGSVICNGMPLNRFVRKYKDVRVPETVIMSYRKSDESRETELCYAAVTFSEKFESMKAAYQSSGRDLDAVYCNNMTLDRFVKKYSQKLLTASVQ